MQLSKQFFSKLHLFHLISCVGFILNPTQNSSHFHLLNSFPSKYNRSCKDQDLGHSLHYFIASLDMTADLTAPENFPSKLTPILVISRAPTVHEYLLTLTFHPEEAFDQCYLPYHCHRTPSTATTKTHSGSPLHVAGKSSHLYSSWKYPQGSHSYQSSWWSP